MITAVEQVRLEIEMADQLLFDTLNHRLDLSKKMAEAKGHNLSTNCPKREETLMAKTATYCKDLDNIDEDTVRKIYPTIFEKSKSIQEEYKETS